MSNVVLLNHYFQICVQENAGLLKVIMSGEIDELLWDQIIGKFNLQHLRLYVCFHGVYTVVVFLLRFFIEIISRLFNGRY